MARPFKKRRVHFVPDFYTFKPASIPKKHLKKIDLSLDELEAIRLADHMGLYQEEAARRMDVSRQTFGNILQSARNKIAQTLIEGAFLQVEVGIVNIGGERVYKCCSCHAEWKVEYGGERPRCCPECNHDQFSRMSLKEEAPRKGSVRRACRNTGEENLPG